MVTSLDKKTALVLIDLQNGITSFPLAHPVAGVLANAARLVSAFRTAKLPVVIVNVDPTESPLNPLRKDASVPPRQYGADFLKIAPEIVVEENDVLITKRIWNAFTNPGLNKELKDREITGIVLAGISTSIGVEGTARSASENGYNITFVSDAMTDMFIEAHEHSFKYIFPRIGETGTTDEVIKFLF